MHEMLPVGTYVLFCPQFDPRVGGFSLPEELLEALFLAHPPDSASGAALWRTYGSSADKVDRSKGMPFEGLPGYKRKEAAGKGGYVWKDEPQGSAGPAGPLYYICDFHELEFRIHPDIIAHYMCPKRRSRLGVRLTFVPAGCRIDMDDYDGTESVQASIDVESLMNDMQDNGNRSPLSQIARHGGAAAVKEHLAAVIAEKMAAVEAHVCPAGCAGCSEESASSSDAKSSDSSSDSSSSDSWWRWKNRE